MTFKIGKTKYLSLLDFTSTFDEERILIIQPLVKTYEEIKSNAEQRIRGYENRLEEEADEQYDDTGMTHHTLLEGQIEDIAFEFRLQGDAIATSLIMLAQSYLHSKFQAIVSTYKFFEKEKGLKKNSTPPNYEIIILH